MSQKDNCNLVTNNQEDKLKCYRGQPPYDFFDSPGTVPYDRDFCNLEHNVELSTKDGLLDCYKNKADVDITKKDCNLVHPVNLDSTDRRWEELQSLYGCYEMFDPLLPKDEEFCRLKYSTSNSNYKDCLKYGGATDVTFNPLNDTLIPLKADFCMYDYLA